VPSAILQKEVEKAKTDGLISSNDSIKFPSTERIPLPPSGYWVMFLSFSYAVYPFLPTNFFVGFSLFIVCSFTSSHPTPFSISLVS
jgi:hypothetical protein